MPIDPGEVRRLAHLARLRIGAGEADALARDLERIVAYIDSLAAVELPDDAEALTYFDTDVTRDDRAGPGLDHDEALRNAPDHDGTFFLVPKIVEKDEA
ncbi:MAG: Asp-tRNA(Asn)/Glu-tRNA(Gln) amidotransferase subunit GatC [Planctomycetota bacterium]|jgi:aspartyl-tRNA(Asn)/glutamyl-tRNA(Gln) amidotransferase subunit C